MATQVADTSKSKRHNFRTRPAWLSTPILAVSAFAIASGMGQFAVTTTIGDVAQAFGSIGDDPGALAQIGLPATTVGIALSLIRLASLASLPLSALADRKGRRRSLIVMAVLGLGFTASAAAAPSFWWFVVAAAIARPALSTVNNLSGVIAAEETRTTNRAAALAVVATAYGVGAGVIALSRGLFTNAPSFRLVMLLAAAPLIILLVLARKLREPEIATNVRAPEGIPGAIPREHRKRVALFAVLTAGIALATGPGFTYLFVYGEGVLNASPLTLSLLVLAAGPSGLAGILAGRFAADRFGRRIASVLAMAGTGFGVIIAYSNDLTALAVGYLVAIAASSAFAPAGGALLLEMFPTQIRATIAGWETVAGVLGAVFGLLTFGALADLTGSFASAARLIGVVVMVGAIGFLGFPETRGRELDETDEPSTGEHGP